MSILHYTIYFKIISNSFYT